MMAVTRAAGSDIYASKVSYVKSHVFEVMPERWPAVAHHHSLHRPHELCYSSSQYQVSHPKVVSCNLLLSHQTLHHHAVHVLQKTQESTHCPEAEDAQLTS